MKKFFEEIYPVPHAVKRLRRTVDCSACRWLVMPEGAGGALKERVRELARRLDRHFPQGMRASCAVPGAGEVFARLRRDAAVKPEGYSLKARTHGFEIVASSDAGFFYGLDSLAQLVDRHGAAALPGLEIDDAPDLTRRGYMLDISRDKVPAMATLKKMIDQLAALRYNELQLYVEHTFEFAGDETVWRDYSPITAAEVMELDEYCSRRFIELVPNLNSFGHLDRWLVHPEYASLAEHAKPWLYKPWNSYMHGVIAPGPEAEAFIARLYDEYLPNFTSDYVNIGCDETFELGQGDGRSAERCQKTSQSQVYFEFLNTLFGLVRSHGRKAMFWGDIIKSHPELIAGLPPDVTALEWGYELDNLSNENCAKFHSAGVRYYVCPGTSTWRSFCGRTGVMLGNIENAARDGLAEGAAGLLLTDWGDCGHIQYWPVSWPGIAMGGGAAWYAAAPNRELAAEAADRVFGCAGAGHLVMEMGRIADVTDVKVCNSGLFFHVFGKLGDQNNPFVKGCSEAEVRNLGERLAAWRQSFDLACPADPLVRDELLNTFELMSLALDKMKFLRGGRIDRCAWRQKLEHAGMVHRRLWLARNRVGGLADSLVWLRAGGLDW
ncbi:MAG: family 20 glycosylhydrolase [Victivallaceae bacterium]|nr:family 20 glycosylhydrolase [Victivallaceae bacterium]